MVRNRCVGQRTQRIRSHHAGPDSGTARVHPLILLASGLLAVQAAIPFFVCSIRISRANCRIHSDQHVLALRLSAYWGETDSLALFDFGFAPFFGGLLVLTALEATVRYVVD